MARLCIRSSNVRNPVNLYLLTGRDAFHIFVNNKLGLFGIHGRETGCITTVTGQTKTRAPTVNHHRAKMQGNVSEHGKFDQYDQRETNPVDKPPPYINLTHETVALYL